MEHSKRETQTRFLLGALLGLAVFLLLYGFGPLNVTNDAFLRGGYVEQDIQQHSAGCLFYRQSPLGLPLCFTQRINWPAGLSVAFTDSIPLFAALFRLLSPLLPSTFQYFGIYTLLCFMLQGGFGALLAGLFTRRTLPALLGAVPFVVSPILLERAFRHTSLAAHFLILGALYYYLLGRRQNRFAYKGLFALNCLAFALHPYFVPMTYAITFALVAGYAWRNRRLLRPAAFLAANLAATACVCWLFGVFSSTGSGAGGTGTATFFSQGRGWVMGDSSSDGRRACGQRHSLSRTSIPSRADTDANHTTTPSATIGPAPADLAQWGQICLHQAGAK